MQAHANTRALLHVGASGHDQAQWHILVGAQQGGQFAPVRHTYKLSPASWVAGARHGTPSGGLLDIKSHVQRAYMSDCVYFSWGLKQLPACLNF